MKRVISRVGNGGRIVVVGEIEETVADITSRSDGEGSSSEGIHSRRQNPVPIQIIDLILTAGTAPFVRAKDSTNLQAARRAPRVKRGLGNQMMSLSPHVAKPQDHGAFDLSFDAEIEVLGVGQDIVDLKARRTGDRLELGPDTRRARGRYRKREALPRIVAASPISVRFLQIDFGRADIEKSEGRITHFEEERQVFNGRVIDAIRGADAGLSGAAKNFAQEAIAEARRVSKTDPGSEIVAVRGGQCLGNSRISRENPSARSIRIHLGLKTGNEGLNLALGVIERLAHLPAQTVIKSDVGFDLVGVLAVDARVLRARVQELAAGLDEEVGRPDQVIGKVASGFVSVKFEVTILRIGVPLVDLDVTKFAAELQGVLAYDLGEVVEALKAVIELPGCPIRKAEGEPGRP